MKQHLAIGLMLLGVAACGGSSSGTPTGPGTPAPTSVAITLRDVILVGTTATATATATMSNGQTQPVTSGFRSDAPGVATVTGAGAVTGVANGEATIVATLGGVDGTKRIRIAPNYEGQWQGTQVVTSCVATGEFAGLCEDGGGVIGVAFPIALRARHPSDLSVSGEFTVEELNFPTFTTSIEGDGGIQFTSATTIEGVRADVSWQINSRELGSATGTIRERYSAPGIFDGDIVYESNVTTLSRTGPGVQELPTQERALRPKPGTPSRTPR